MATADASAPPPRVVLLTRDALYVRDFLSALVEQEHLPFTLVGVGLSTRVWRRGPPGRLLAFADAARWVRRVGPAYALYMAWVAELAPWCLRAKPSPQRLARTAGVAVRRISDVNAPAVRAWLARCAPTLLLSVHWNQWLAPDTVAVAPLGGVNVHPSPLPAYRGVDPVHTMLRAGVTELGCTLHRVTPTIDGGDVLAQRRMPAVPGGRIPSNRALFRMAGAMVRQLCQEGVEQALARACPQEGAGASYYGWEAIRR